MEEIECRRLQSHWWAERQCDRLKAVMRSRIHISRCFGVMLRMVSLSMDFKSSMICLVVFVGALRSPSACLDGPSIPEDTEATSGDKIRLCMFASVFESFALLSAVNIDLFDLRGKIFGRTLLNTPKAFLSLRFIVLSTDMLFFGRIGNGSVAVNPVFIACIGLTSISETGDGLVECIRGVSLSAFAEASDTLRANRADEQREGVGEGSSGTLAKAVGEAIEAADRTMLNSV